MTRPPPRRFLVLRLNTFSDASWSVIEHPSGAIALDGAGTLVMRLTEAQARDMASAMNAALEDDASAPAAAPPAKAVMR